MQRQSSAHSICGRALGRLGLRSLGTSGSATGSRLCRSPRRFCCMSLTSCDRPRNIFALFWMVLMEETKVPRAPVGASVCWLQIPTMKSWSACRQSLSYLPPRKQKNVPAAARQECFAQGGILDGVACLVHGLSRGPLDLLQQRGAAVPNSLLLQVFRLRVPARILRTSSEESG